MLFFNKVQVLVFDKGGKPFQIIQATKKGKVLWFQKKNWSAKEDSVLRFGKRIIYTAQRIDDSSLVAYSLKGNELKADEHWLEALNKSYFLSSNKFKIGFDKYKELISMVITVCFICIMVLGSVKYTSDLTPIEADAMAACSSALAEVAPYYAEGSKANQLIAESLELEPKKEIPK